MRATMLKPAISAAALVVFTLLSAQVVSAAVVWHTDLETARREAQRLNRPILCHFGAKWCAPCQKMEQSVLNQSAVATSLQNVIVGLKVDVDQHPELGQRFGVTQFPTDIIIEPNGTRLMESTGYRPMNEYLDLIDRAGRRYNELLAQRKPKQTPSINTLPENGNVLPDPNGDPQMARQGEPMLMLEGYCPVTLGQKRSWVKGDPQFQSDYKGQRYQFVSQAAQQEFQVHADRYVPQFLGCDPVVVWTTDRAMAGSIEWGAYYDDLLYLFTTEENRRKFKQAPDKYLTTKVVLDVDQIESVLR